MTRAFPSSSLILPEAILHTIAERNPLVGTDSVQTFCGIDAEKVSHAIEEGRFRWVFDLNNGSGEIQARRFLSLELFRPEVTKTFTLDNALAVVLGERRENFGRTEVGRRLRIARSTVYKLDAAGHLPGNRVGREFTICRAALETFLRSRWIGHGGAK